MFTLVNIVNICKHHEFCISLLIGESRSELAADELSPLRLLQQTHNPEASGLRLFPPRRSAPAYGCHIAFAAVSFSVQGYQPADLVLFVFCSPKFPAYVCFLRGGFSLPAVFTSRSLLRPASFSVQGY